MKTKITVWLMLFMAFISFAQDCNIGNTDGDDPLFENGNILPDYLLGVNFTLSQVGVLQSLNIIGNGTRCEFSDGNL